MSISADMKKDTLISSSFVAFLSYKPPIYAKTAEFSSIPPQKGAHYHDYPEMWYCHSGHYTHETENGEHSCGPGSVVIIPPGVMHRLNIPENSKGSISQICVTFNFFEDVDAAAHISSIAHMLLPRFESKLGFSLPEFVALSKESQLVAEKLLTEQPGLNELDRFFALPEFELSAKQKKAALTVAKTRLYPILHALTFMNANYSKKLTSEDLTAVSSLCRTNFLSAFKRYLGISYSTYHIMLRVARAQYAIAHTQYSLQYISDMCGFATSSYMSKCYKRYKGILPKVDRAYLKVYRNRYPNIHISHDFFDDTNQQNELR